jgi:1-deoxy-D-xylulose-5-phosphate synthase
MLKNAVYHSNYFEDLGIYYMGPADGHDVPTLCRMLREAMQEKQPVVLHVKTSKGKGYPPAEAEPNRYHGIPPKSLSSQTDCQPIHYSTRMGQILCQEAEKDNRIVAITAAMADGCGLVEFSKKFPKRFFDVGIAEEHALVFAAGLACQGMIPVFAVYSTFLQRGYDNILHDIALQGLPVIICIDRASLSSGDGPTHHGIYDVAFLSHIPGITLLAPFDFASLSDCMTYALQAGSPVCLRYPNAAEDLRLRSFCSKGDFGIRFSFDSEESVDVILISYGKIASEALKAVDNLQEEGIKGGLVLLEQLKPLQAPAKALLHRLSSKKVPILFLEEGIKNGSAAMLLYEEIRSNPLLDQRIYQILAIDDQFGFSKAGETIYESCHISALDLCRAVKECLSKDKKETNPGDRI